MIDGVRRCLVAAAHPDDEMACSGLIQRLADDGVDVTLLTFSDCHESMPAGYLVADLLEEWKQATDLIGVTTRTLYDFPTRRLPEYAMEIRNVFDAARGQYDLVLVAAPADLHQDHWAVAREAIRVFKTSATILGYEHPSNHVVEAHEPVAFLPLTPAQLDRKVQHVTTYRSQESRPYMREEFVRGLAAVRGVQAGVQYAEAYAAVRWRL